MQRYTPRNKGWETILFVFFISKLIRNTYAPERKKHDTEAQKYDISEKETLAIKLMEVIMIEISRNSIYNDLSGSACGSVNIVFVDAEIVLRDEAETVYFFGEWDSELCESRCMSTRKSMLDICARLTNNADDIDLLTAERRRIESERIADDDKYQNYYTEIKRMISKEMSSHGYKSVFTD